MAEGRPAQPERSGGRTRAADTPEAPGAHGQPPGEDGGPVRRTEPGGHRAPRARELGLVPPGGTPGPYNALTDVPGVAVGHTTLLRPPDVHTGVTAIVPDGVGPVPGGRLPAGLHAGNGYGKLIGATQLAELGELESPVVLTSTLSAFRAADALVDWMLERPDCTGVRSFNPVVGECNDGLLSDIRSRPVRGEHVRAALRGATDGPVAEGCVGAGTGTCALGFKAGIGTASRRVTPECAAPVTLGVLVQANFGGTLRTGGTPVVPPAGPGTPGAVRTSSGEDGSCMLVVATDAPLDSRRLTRIARRAVFALARVGAAFAHGSGDYALALSTARPVRGTAPAPLPDAHLDPLFAATLEAVEEAVLNALCAAVTTTGPGGRTAHAVPPELLRRAAAHGA
ncbi:P1 family peptidase [Streptomyces sp. JJ36]|uniref:P1 family peptidase n=1 Tax=Streptomyces sp. JJ36 TaxID=2736645 RepID=UPI001F162CDE|nr:P1 family peptidase [Streptomyces sp. JJ36]MCF6522641.1 P1 family peptidase [Streptomyces sp. JJ36]